MATKRRNQGKSASAGWRQSINSLSLEAVGVALVTRLALAMAVWLTIRVIPTLPLYPGQLPDSFFLDHPALDGWTRWDGAHYVAIANVGYGPANPSPDGGIGFFPLYPLAMRFLAAITPIASTPRGYAIAGLIIANLSYLAACALLPRLALPDVGQAGARNATWLLCLVPFGFFFNAVYAESLFLLLALSAVLLGRHGRWTSAAGIAGLAGATRLVGLALAPALVFAAWRAGQRGWQLVITGLLSTWGTVVFFGWSAWRFNDPLAYFHAQATWGGWREHVWDYIELFFTNPREAIGGDPRNMIIFANLLLALVALALLPFVWRMVDPALAVFTVLLVITQFAFTWVSLGRYLLPAAGLYVAAGALLTRPRWSGSVRDAVFAVCAIGMTLLAILFSHGFWVV